MQQPTSALRSCGTCVTGQVLLGGGGGERAPTMQSELRGGWNQQMPLTTQGYAGLRMDDQAHHGDGYSRTVGDAIQTQAGPQAAGLQ